MKCINVVNTTHFFTIRQNIYIHFENFLHIRAFTFVSRRLCHLLFVRLLPWRQPPMECTCLEVQDSYREYKADQGQGHTRS